MKRNHKRNHKRPWIVLCSFCFLLAAALCAFGAEQKKPAAPQLLSKPQAVQTAPPADALPQATQKPERVYSYNPLGKPDPFKPFVDAKIVAAAKTKAAKTESIFPLQRAGVENFNVVGIMGDKVRRVAIVEDAGKKFYPLFVGTRMGIHNGKVAEILADRVIVDEFDGKKTRRVVLKLRQNQ